MIPELHVVFGAGQVGQPLARLLVLAGKRVRIAKRSSATVPAGSGIVLGDAADPSFCVEAARGATTVSQSKRWSLAKGAQAVANVAKKARREIDQ
jgi:uncharacterized protein YbjT (DUF2867 family)